MTHSQDSELASPDHESFLTCYRRGIMATLRISVFSFVFGILFLTAALSRGFEPAHAMLMSISVFAGSVLFAEMELWTNPLPYVAMAITAASVGSRHILMGLTLPPVFSRHVKRPPLASLFFLTDLNWILTTKATDVPNKYAFYLGASTVIYSTWVLGSLLGLIIVQFVDATTIQATRSMGPIFLCLIIIMLSKGFQGSRLPWLFAAVASGLASLYSIKIAVLTGVAVGMIAAWFTCGEIRDA